MDDGLTYEIFLHNVGDKFGTGVFPLVISELHNLEKLVKAKDKLSVFS